MTKRPEMLKEVLLLTALSSLLHRSVSQKHSVTLPTVLHFLPDLSPGTAMNPVSLAITKNQCCQSLCINIFHNLTFRLCLAVSLLDLVVWHLEITNVLRTVTGIILFWTILTFIFILNILNKLHLLNICSQQFLHHNHNTEVPGLRKWGVRCRQFYTFSGLASVCYKC